MSDRSECVSQRDTAADAIWYLTQMRRREQISEARQDLWFHDVAKKVYGPAIFLDAARQLVDEGLAHEVAFPGSATATKPHPGRGYH